MIPALHETLTCLNRLAREPIEPPEALRAVSELRARTGAQIELVWEREPYTDRVHYDALVRDGDATISLAVCPDQGVPWPLRGLQRWSDSDLLRVDGQVASIQTAVDLLDLVWGEDRLLTRLVDAALLFREKAERGITDPTADDLQDAVDDFRRERGLWTAEATDAWLSEHGLDLPRLEAALADRVVEEKIRDQVIDLADLADPRPLDAALVTIADFTDPDLADRAAAAEEGLLAFVRTAIAAGEDVQIEVIRRVHRRDLPPAHASAIVDGRPGDRVLLNVPGRRRLVEVVRTLPADAQDPDTRLALRKALFQDWLRARREQAHVEWSWGRTQMMGHSG